MSRTRGSNETLTTALATPEKAVAAAAVAFQPQQKEHKCQQYKKRLFYYANALMRFLAALDFTSVQ